MPQGEKYFLAVFASCCLGKQAGYPATAYLANPEHAEHFNPIALPLVVTAEV